MMKFFRKYMKHLLAIFMALLLVVWLGGSALQALVKPPADNLDQKRGEALGKTVKMKDMQFAYYDSEIIDKLTPSPLWQQPWVLAGFELGLLSDARFEYVRSTPLEPEEWYMLWLDAREKGIQVSPDALSAFKQVVQIDARRLTALRDNMNISLERIDDALASLARVAEAAELQCRAVKVSEAEIQDLIQQTQEQVRVRFVALDADSLIDESYEPTGQELTDLFEKHKAAASRPSGGLDFGYQQPEKAQVEYIQVRIEPLAKLMEVGDVEANRYWKENSTRFTKPAETQPESAPDAKPAPPEPYTTFHEARSDVIAALQKQKARERARQIADELITRLREPWLNQPATQPGGYTTPPPSQTADTVYPDLIRQFEAKYPGVLEYGRTKLADYAGLRADEQIGTAFAMVSSDAQIDAPSAAFLVAGLETDPKDLPSHRRYFRNIFETAREHFVNFRTGDAYVIRTVAAQPVRVPDSIEEVREQLVKDARRRRAYEQAGDAAKALADAARASGSLADALDARPELKAKLGEKPLQEPPPFTRKRFSRTREGAMQVATTNVPRVGPDPAFIDLCFSLVGKTSTQPAGVDVLEQATHTQWVVVQARELLPVTRDDYGLNRRTARDYIRTERQIGVLYEWFAPENVRGRVLWKDAPDWKTSPDEEPDAEETS